LIGISSPALLAMLCKTAVAVIIGNMFISLTRSPMANTGKRRFQTPNVLSTGFLVRICDSL